MTRITPAAADAISNAFAAPAKTAPIADASGAEMERLVKAAHRFDRARTEFRRALDNGEQPRLSNAGTRIACAEIELVAASRALRARLKEQTR